MTKGPFKLKEKKKFDFGNGTDMSKLRSKQARSRKGISEHQYFSNPKSQGDEPIVEYSMKKKK